MASRASSAAPDGSIHQSIETPALGLDGTNEAVRRATAHSPALAALLRMRSEQASSPAASVFSRTSSNRGRSAAESSPALSAQANSPALSEQSRAGSKRPRSESRPRSSRSVSIAASEATSVATDDSTTTNGRAKKKKKIENPSLYDLVAGKVRQPSRLASYDGRLLTKPFPPSEWYFERHHMKTGNKAEDARLYWHPEVDKHDLPPSDLLWAIHRYASHHNAERGKGAVKFMDETALLAMGVLLEETMKHELGGTSYKAFLEREQELGNEDDTTEDSEEDDDDVEDVDMEFARLGAVKGKQPARSRAAAYAAGYTNDDFLTDEEDEG